MLDTSMNLPDGRTLAFTVLGASNGPCCVYFHGAPSSRLDLMRYDDTLAQLGVRVVSPDRPGYGGSSPQPGRRLEDWPSDVAALADHLAVERFAVMGLSSGGPYAIACAALLSGRVASAAVVAGVSDFGWADAWQGLVEWETTVMGFSDDADAITWCEEHFGPDGSKFFDAVAGDPMAGADEAFLQDEQAMASLVSSFSEAFRQGVGGYAQDARLQGAPWSFDLAAITAPALVIHGADDTMVPLAHARHTAEVVPGAELRIVPNHGHISLLSQVPTISAELTASLR